LILCGASLLTLAGGARGAEPEGPRVDRLGSRDRLVIEGAESFSAEELKSKLFLNFDFLLAGHPRGPRKEYLAAVERCLLAGYRRCGFPNVRVKAELDPDGGKVRVKVVEGPRYVCGAVRVVGAKKVAAEKLRRWLTSARAAPKLPRAAAPGSTWKGPERKAEPRPPIWKAGDPAPFDALGAEGLAKSVSSAYLWLGRSFARARVRVKPGADGKRATLEVEVLDEGREVRVNDLEITGFVRNTRQGLLKHLKLKPEDVLDQKAIDRINAELYLSGRFAFAVVQPAGEAAGAPPSRFRLRVAEVPGVTPLGRELSDVEKALLRVRDWLAAFPESDQDLVVVRDSREAGGGTLESLILSPSSGVMASLKGVDARGRTQIDLVLVGKGDRLEAYSRTRRAKLIGGKSGWLVSLVLSMNYNAVKGSSSAVELNVGGMIGPAEPGTGTGSISVDVQMAPAAFVCNAHRKGFKCSLKDGKLIMEGDVKMVADARTGRLTEIFWKEISGEEGTARMTFARGAMKKELEALEKDAAGYRNCYDPKCPVVSVGGFAVEEAAAVFFSRGTAEQRNRAAEVMRKLAGAKVLGPLERAMRGAGRGEAGEPQGTDPAREFRIPMRAPGDLTANPMQVLAQLAPIVALPFAEVFFPRESWPWTLARETGLTVMGRGRYTVAELQRLYESKKVGPVGYLVAAELLSLVNDRLKKLFAARGLEVLSAAGFRRDVEAMLGPGHPPGKCAFLFLEVLGGADEKDVKAMAAAMDPQSGKLLEKWAGLLRKREGGPIKEIPPELVDAIWKELCAGAVEARLRELADKPKRSLFDDM
jgi:hypothetical protein